jgi:hypothetical protein
MAKTEAQAEALKLFIESQGRTPLKAIADAVGVSYFSVRRWYKAQDWKERMEAVKEAPIVKKRKRAEEVVTPKKDVVDKAERPPQVAPVPEAASVPVGPEPSEEAPQVDVTVIPEPTETTTPAQIAPTLEIAPITQSATVDIEAITSLQDLVTLNERLRSILDRNFLTAAEIEHLSNAKLTLLEAAEVYLGIVKSKRE